jgi:hypothetical protein
MIGFKPLISLFYMVALSGQLSTEFQPEVRKSLTPDSAAENIRPVVPVDIQHPGHLKN